MGNAARPPGRGEYRIGEVMGGQYRVLEVLLGGMGLVYIVEDLKSLQRQIRLRFALKTFQDRYLWDAEAMARFEREAMNWVQLGAHPHIVHALVVERIDGKPYIWLQFVEGESLAERLARRPLEIQETLDLASQFTRGMRYAQEQHGLIHRDIKPANILITRDGVLKVTDFGLSKLRVDLRRESAARGAAFPTEESENTQANAFATASGVMVGTPAYMPPEAILDAASVGTPGDIYSFGIVLYEMLTGRCVFTGPNLFEQHLRAHPVPVRALNPTVPRALDELVSQCLEKEPEKRFQSFAELASALQQVTRKLPGAPQPTRPRASDIPAEAEWFMKAATLMGFARYEEAIRCYAEVIRLDPKSAEAYNNMGLCLGELGRFDEAASCAEKAVALQPDYPEAWANLGGLYAARGAYQDGLVACERALKLKPDWPDAHANRGVNLAALDRFEEAMDCFERALQANPRYYKAYVMAAEVLARRDTPPAQILPLLEKAFAINPRDAGVLAFMAACFDDLGQVEEARRYLKLARQVDSSHPLLIQVEQVLKRKYG